METIPRQHSIDVLRKNRTRNVMYRKENVTVSDLKPEEKYQGRNP
jgi:hypothetical protein